MKICYFDNFTSQNSNDYWYKAFKRLGAVTKFDVIPINKNQEWATIPKKVRSFQPTHIHFGGSIKHGSIVSVGFIRWIREAFPHVRITYFFGDGYNKMAYYKMLEPYVDKIFMSNSKWSDGQKYTYTPCPAPQENIREWMDKKKYDVVFIGNNYNADRLQNLKALAKNFNVTVFGQRWPAEMKSPGPVSFEDYSNVCSQAKIVLADPAGPMCANSTGQECLAGDPDKLWTKGLCRAYTCSAYEELAGYLSNRLANTLIAGTVHLVPYVEGLEEHWTNFEDFVWYHNDKERNQLIKKLLADPELCKKIALTGQRKVFKNYTYDKCAAQFLNIDVLKLRKAKEKDAARYCKLRNADSTYKWFFSEKKFKLKEVIAWLQGLDPNDEVYMAEIDGKVVGTCSLYNYEDSTKQAEVGRIIVAENQRGKGLGTRMLEQISELAISKGILVLYANIKKDNISSQRAFKKAGYVQQGETQFWRTL